MVCSVLHLYHREQSTFLLYGIRTLFSLLELRNVEGSQENFS